MAAPTPNAPPSEAVSAADPALIRRFASDFAAALGRPVTSGEPVALAVSGGPDSMAMLTLAAGAFPGQVIAATVDHQLRRESAGEAAMVAEHCATLGVAHAILVPPSPIATTNIQAGARAARYALLENWAIQRGAAMLATAHHADDQAETFLMRAARGSGVAGLAGIRARQRVMAPSPPEPAAGARPLDIIRPLLGWRVAELRELVERFGVPFVDDPSNADDHYDRTRFRALLNRTDLLDAAHLAQSAANLAEADAALRAVERWLWQARKIAPVGPGNPDEEVWLDLSDLPRELKRRLARTAIGEVRLVNGITRPEFSPASNIEALLDAIEGGTAVTHAGVMVTPQPGKIWRFQQAPPRRSG